MTETRVPPRDPNQRVHESYRPYEEWRTAAQTDTDRVWYSPEFRRLEGVTQVVPPQDDYVFHDRLTHSVKVAQVAATLARKQLYVANDPTSNLHRALKDNGLAIESWIDPDYCYVAGLAHDIGHPPFGHAGEQALQSLMETRGGHLKTRSFEGNAQSTRTVAHLSFRKPNVDGLDLTLRSLAAIAKYPWLRGKHPAHITKLAKKWSFYAEEENVLELLHKHGFVKAVEEGENEPVVTAVYRWPEAEIMDWADDISYAVHDLEDFYRAGRIPLHRISLGLSRAPKSMHKGDDPADLKTWLTTSFSFVGDDEEVKAALRFTRAKMLRVLNDDGSSLEEQVPAAFVQIMRVLLESMPTNRFDGSRQAHTDLQKFGSSAIAYLSENCGAEVIDAAGETRVAFRVSGPTRLAAEFFKAICQYYVIESSGLATMQYGQSLGIARVVDALVTMSVSWLERQGEVNSQNALPARLREYLREQSEELASIDGTNKEKRAEVLKAQRNEIYKAVIDYACGLRDLQTTILEERLFGHKPSLLLASNWLDI